MRNKKYVFEKIRYMENSNRFSKKSVEQLPNLLGEEEELIFSIDGFYENNRWLINLTDKRLLFVYKGLIDLKTKNISLDKIESVEFDSGLVLGSLKIWIGGEFILISNVSKPSGRSFVEKVNNQLEYFKQQLYQPKVEYREEELPKIKEDLVEKLLQLSNLKESGILTEEEFQIAKQKVLNS